MASKLNIFDVFLEFEHDINLDSADKFCNFLLHNFIIQLTELKETIKAMIKFIWFAIYTRKQRSCDGDQLLCEQIFHTTIWWSDEFCFIILLISYCVLRICTKIIQLQ